VFVARYHREKLSRTGLEGADRSATADDASTAGE